MTTGNPIAFARCELARATKYLGPDHPDVAKARQRYEAVKLTEYVSAVIPRLSQEQIDGIAALLNEHRQEVCVT